MRNNAAYLPESPIVYIILPKSIRNRASLRIFDFKDLKNHICIPFIQEIYFFISAIKMGIILYICE